MRKVQIVAVLILLIGACRKNDPSPSHSTPSNKPPLAFPPPTKPVPIPPKPEFKKEDFPMNVGNWWRYKVYDTYSRQTDTLKLIVKSVTTVGNITQYNCDIRNRKGIIIDNSYYRFSDSLVAYNSQYSYSYFGSFILKLPFRVGDKWAGFTPYDTITAVGSGTKPLKILGNSYAPVFTLKREVIVPNYYNIQSVFVSPKIGVFYQSLDIHDSISVPQLQNFQLIDYELK